MLNIVSREGWLSQDALATDAKEPPPLELPVSHVFLINTQTKPCTHRVYCDGVVRRLQLFHCEVHGLSDIRYNFLIGGDGTVYEGRGWLSSPELPAVDSQLSKTSIVISCIGPYAKAEEMPQKLLDASWALINHGVNSGFIKEDFEQHFLMIDRNYFHEGMIGNDQA